MELLFVTYTECGKMIRLINARRATPKERHTYEEEAI